MATLQQLETALVNADRAGDADAARKLSVVATAARLALRHIKGAKLRRRIAASLDEAG